MRIGIIDTIFPGLGLDQSFQAAAKIGAEGVEVSYSESDRLQQPGHLRYLSQLAKKHSLAVPSLCLGFLAKRPALIGPPEMIAESQRHIAEGLLAAAKVGAAAVLVPCVGKNAIETEEELNCVADALGELAEQAEEAGVVIGIESNLSFSHQQFLLGCIGNTGSVKVYHDTAIAMSRKLDVATGIRDLGLEATAQIHFKDVRVTEGEPPDYNVEMGQGNVDFRAVVEALKAIGYDGWIILEAPPVGDPLQSAKANVAFIRELLGA